jgi:hypothetical protein
VGRRQGRHPAERIIGFSPGFRHRSHWIRTSGD